MILKLKDWNFIEITQNAKSIRIYSLKFPQNLVEMIFII